MRKTIKYGVAATLLAGAAAASAATLPSFADSGALQNGVSESAECQTANLAVDYTPNGSAYYLKSITVSNINSACFGRYMSVTVINPLGERRGMDTVLVDSNSETLNDYPGQQITDYSGTGQHNAVDHVAITISDNPPA